MSRLLEIIKKFQIAAEMLSLENLALETKQNNRGSIAWLKYKNMRNKAVTIRLSLLQRYIINKRCYYTSLLYNNRSKLN